MEHILSIQKAKQLRKQLLRHGKKVVLVGGCFDILHIGHISLIQGAKKYADTLIIFLESDETIRAMKGENRPVHTQKQRAQILSALADVDFVILLPPNMSNEDYDNLTKLIQPAIIATTKNDPGLGHKKRQAKLVEAKIVFANKPIHTVSTSKFISLLENEI